MDVQSEFPSMAEELFQLAILRLRRAVKLRKEALEYFKVQSGTKDSIVEPETPDALLPPQKTTTMHEEARTQPVRKSMCLKQIDEILESSRSSSCEELIPEAPDKGFQKAKSTQQMVRIKHP